MSITIPLLRGIAAHIALNTPFVYRMDGTPYTAGEMPVTIGGQHPSIDNTLNVADYLDVPLQLRVTEIHVQLRTRHRSFDEGRILVDQLRDLFHDKRYLILGGITVSRITLTSFIPLGRDANGRWEWTQNFRLLLNRPQP